MSRSRSSSQAPTLGFMPPTLQRQPSTVSRAHAAGRVSTLAATSERAPERLSRALSWPRRGMQPTQTRNRAVSDLNPKSVTWALDLPTPHSLEPPAGNPRTHRRTPSPYPAGPSALPVPPLPAKDNDRWSYRLPIRSRVPLASPDSDDDNAECFADAEDNTAHPDPVIDDHLPHLRLPPPDSGYFNAQSHIDPANAYYKWKFSEEEGAYMSSSDSMPCPSLESCSEQTEDSDPTPYSSLGSKAGTFTKYVSTPLLYRRRSLKDQKRLAQAQQERVIEWVDAEVEEEPKQKARDELTNHDPREPVQQPAEVVPPWHEDWLPTDPSYLASITHFPAVKGKRIPIFTWDKVTEISLFGSPRTVISSVRPPKGVTVGNNDSGIIPSHTPDEMDEEDSELFWRECASRPVNPADLISRLKRVARTIEADREQHEELGETRDSMPEELFYSATEDSGYGGTTDHVEYADTTFVRTPRPVFEPAKPVLRPRVLRGGLRLLPPPGLSHQELRQLPPLGLSFNSRIPAVPMVTTVPKDETLDGKILDEMLNKISKIKQQGQIPCNPFPRTADITPLLLEGSPSLDFAEMSQQTQKKDDKWYRRRFGPKL